MLALLKLANSKFSRSKPELLIKGELVRSFRSNLLFYFVERSPSSKISSNTLAA